MNAAWKLCADNKDFIVSELIEQLRGNKWSVSTVKTMLDRLVEKGVLTSIVRGHTCFYRAAVEREKVARENIAVFLDSVLDDALGPLVAYLANRKQLSEKDILTLERLLQNHRGK